MQRIKFFLLYHGHGYTDEGIRHTPMDELMRDVNMLKEQLEEENRARAAAAKQAARRGRR